MSFATIAVGLAFVVVPLSGLFQGRTFGTGGSLFRFISLVGFAFCVLTGVFLTSDCLSEEKREGTLGFLFLTDLRGYDIMLGKLLATSLSAFYGVFAIFPVLAISLTLGGVTPGEFWRMVLVFINTLFFSLAAGVFVSSISRLDNRAMAGTFMVIVLVVAILPTTEFVLTKFRVVAPNTLSLPSPVTAWRLTFDAPYRVSGQSFWNSLGLTHLSSWSLLILASILLPRVWQQRPGLVPAFASRRFVVEAESPRRLARRAAMLDQNPAYWLAGRNSSANASVMVAFALLSLGGWCLSQSNPVVRIASSFLVGTGFPLILRVMIGLSACRFFVELRRNGALELLLSTPLTVKEILGGQWLALRRMFLFPATAIVGLQLLLLSLALPGNSSAGLVGRFGLEGWAMSLGALSFLPDLFAAAWIGVLVGLTAKKIALAPGLTLLYAIVLPGVGFLFCIPPLLIDIPLIFWARDKLHRELRQLGSARYPPIASAPDPPMNRPIPSRRL